MATTVTPSTPFSSASSRAPIVRDISLSDRLMLGLFVLVTVTMMIIEFAWTGLLWVFRRGAVTAQTYHLDSEQYNALMALVWLQHETDQPGWFDFSSLEDDRCTLAPRELQALERCAAAGVSSDLIKRFAPAYAGSTIVPRPD